MGLRNYIWKAEAIMNEIRSMAGDLVKGQYMIDGGKTSSGVSFGSILALRRMFIFLCFLVH